MVVAGRFQYTADSLVTSENASLGQDKKTKHKPVTNTFSSFQSECVEIETIQRCPLTA